MSKEMKTKKAEQILRRMKKRDRKVSRPYQGPPDMDFVVQQTTKGTGERILREFNQSTLDDVGPWTGAG
jgi:hypothetical protein